MQLFSNRLFNSYSILRFPMIPYIMEASTSVIEESHVNLLLKIPGSVCARLGSKERKTPSLVLLFFFVFQGGRAQCVSPYILSCRVRTLF
jgi:hypothetical protein